jgi:glutaryl-CoA dehydrogenase
VVLGDASALVDFDSLLDDEERMIRQTVRSFVDKAVRPNIAAWFEEGVAPRELAS